MTRRVISDVRRNARTMDVGGAVPPPGPSTQEITPDFIASAGQTFAPTLVYDQDIAPGFIASTGQIFAPSVGALTQTITPGFISSTGAIYAPSASTGGSTQAVTLDFISSTGAIYAPTVSRLELLDMVTASAAAAWSVSRLLRAAYSGSAYRVRRASDSTEQDIGFTADGYTDDSALASFCSGTNGFVTTVYDQSGNGRDLTQTTAARQPKIYDSSTGRVTAGSNSVTAMDFDGSDDRLQRTDALGFSGNPAITLVGNFQLDSGITTDRFIFGLGNTPVSNGTAILHMAKGTSNKPAISFVAENTDYTLGSNPAMTTWQTALLARASGALESNSGTQYAINGTFLTADTSSHPSDTPSLSNDQTSWGDALNAGLAFFAGLASTRCVFTSQITDGSDDEIAIFDWFANE